MGHDRYEILIEPAPVGDGGGFYAIVPDLPGCVSDGETPDKARANALGAIADWIAAAEELGRVVPEPSGGRLFA